MNLQIQERGVCKGAHPRSPHAPAILSHVFLQTTAPFHYASRQALFLRGGCPVAPSVSADPARSGRCSEWPRQPPRMPSSKPIESRPSNGTQTKTWISAHAPTAAPTITLPPGRHACLPTLHQSNHPTSAKSELLLPLQHSAAS